MAAALAGVSRLPPELRIRPVGDVDNVLARHGGLAVLQAAGVCTGRTLDPDVAHWLSVLGLPDVQITVVVDRPRRHADRLLGPPPVFEAGVDPELDPVGAYEALTRWNASRGRRGVVVLCRRDGNWVAAARLWQTRQHPHTDAAPYGPGYDGRQLAWNQRWNSAQWRTEPGEHHHALAAAVWPDPGFSAAFRARAAYLLAARDDDTVAMPTGPGDPLADELAVLVYDDLGNDEIDEVVVSYLGDSDICTAIDDILGPADPAALDTINLPAGLLEPVLERWQRDPAHCDLLTDLCGLGLSVPQARIVAAAADASCGRASVAATEFRVGSATHSPYAVAIADTLQGRVLHSQSSSVDGQAWMTLAPATPDRVHAAVQAMCCGLPAGEQWVWHRRKRN
ncbi:ESX secretion-associated protein EspG [Mycobacterium nebraskense]|uniref:ESX secretion-associated protein EspG n=1 Tax=Mycobacterium nebraskense TaxID=244292 RepID=UPI00142D6B9B|nr:ESX secretion-associated protein EspG [Mycobacterium nebraskense]